MRKVGKILLMYDRLKDNKRIKKQSIMMEFNICDATYENYISEIRCHLSNSSNYSETLVYNRIDDDYRLIKNNNH